MDIGKIRCICYAQNTGGHLLLISVMNPLGVNICRVNIGIYLHFHFQLIIFHKWNRCYKKGEIFIAHGNSIDNLHLNIEGHFNKFQWQEVRDTSPFPLQWRHNEHDGVSNYLPHNCLLKRLFRPISKKTSKLRVTGLCEGNSPVTGEFPTKRASNEEYVSIWWRLM